MKRKDLVRALLEHGAVFVREGSDHTVYQNPRTGSLLAVPRHTEIKEGMVHGLLKAAKRA